MIDMTEREARLIVNTVSQQLLRLGVPPTKLGEFTIQIKEMANGDPQKTVDGYNSLLKRVNELLMENA